MFTVKTMKTIMLLLVCAVGLGVLAPMVQAADAAEPTAVEQPHRSLLQSLGILAKETGIYRFIVPKTEAELQGGV